MSWKDKFIINIQKQSNLVCNSQTIYDEETINKEISFEELITNQSLIARYAKNATEQEIAELIEKHGLELTEKSLITLLKTARPLLIVAQHNQQLVKEIFEKNLNLKNRFKGIYEKFAESVLKKEENLSNERINLESLDIEERTYEMCLDAVKQNSDSLYHVPPKFRTPELYLAAVEQNGEALKDVPLGLRTEDLCLAAVQKDGEALSYVPWYSRTPELCLIAVQQNGIALFCVPEELRTEDICWAAIEKDGKALKYVPLELRTEDLCLAAVQQNGRALWAVPKELKTQKLCWEAVQQNGDTLYHVPPKFRTPELCSAAVEQNGKALCSVPMELRTTELYLAAIKNVVPDSCKAFYKYFIAQMKEKISTFHDFENSFFTTKELLSMKNVKKYHWDSFFGKFSSNNAMGLYKLFNKKKGLVDYQVDKIENIDALSSEGIRNMYSTYISPFKQAEFLQSAPRKMHDYTKTVEYLLDEEKTSANRLIEHFERIPAKLEIKEKHPVLKHRVMEINGFKFEILDRADETGLILGNLTGCCQVLGGMNSDAVYDGFLNPKSNFLAVYYKDRLIAQSWLRLGKPRQDPVTKEMKAVLYLDNIESNAPFSVNYGENFNKEKYELLKASFIEFAKFMKNEYKLLNVIVGKGYSDVTFDELLLDTPTVKEDFVGEEDLTSDLENDKNYIIANIRRSEMKIVKANKNKLRVTLSKAEWQQIGKKSGWVKSGQTHDNEDKTKYPKCQYCDGSGMMWTKIRNLSTRNYEEAFCECENCLGTGHITPSLRLRKNHNSDNCPHK